MDICKCYCTIYIGIIELCLLKFKRKDTGINGNFMKEN